MAFKLSRNTRIGIVVVVALALLTWGVNYLKGVNFFSNEQVFYAKYDKINGLDRGRPVLINGHQVGQVRSIEMNDDFTVIVEFTVTKDVNIPLNTVARIVSQGIMGNMAIDLVIYDTTATHVSGDILLSDIEKNLQTQVSEEVAPVKKKAEQLLADIDTVIIAVQTILSENTAQNLKKSIESIRNTIGYLEGTAMSLDTLMKGQRAKLARIIGNVESFSANLKDNNDRITNVIRNFSSISDTLAKAQIASTIGEAEKALGQANKIFERINRGEGTMGMLVNNDTLYRNLEQASKKLDRLLEDMRINPKRYVSFPLFDFGRTTYVVDEKPKKKKKEGK
ncbi:MAG: hypothetical protein A2W91_02890 [Bacteroidetes bacterium GWF2_38_335]|nr:MAG: hypothetical protein A2W91_02890 [Bacteroidetes bacterium GWF2_38_335]OFY77562.1 MAG: hypothetical protein A2281_01870 [Bacteroidetes bacterium RIFOXYA12_FULL_38_20]HBS87139.1 MCE family protein [Bacteroidales bacterium]